MKSDGSHYMNPHNTSKQVLLMPKNFFLSTPLLLPLLPRQSRLSPQLIILTILLWLTSSQAYAATLSASVDRHQLGSGETLELRVKYDSQTSSDPDFSPLERDFDVLSKNQQNQFSFINGTSVSFTEWRLQLLPKKTGQLLIPALSFKGESSSPIQIEVNDRPIGNTSHQPIFIETEVEKKSVYVQEQLLLTLRVLTSTGLQGISSEELMVKDATVTKVSENQFQKQINGINHLVIELTYAIFPNTSGELTIPAVRFEAIIPERRDPYSNSFFSRGGKRMYLNSEEQKITIMPRPVSYGSGEWLPSKGITLSERWSRPLDELVAGEPITRTVYIGAQGLTSAQLPPLAIHAGDDLKVYPDQPQLKDDVSSNGVTGTRIESVAIVPSKGGSIRLPDITLKWWDTTTNQVKETTLTGPTLTVKPAANTPAPTTTAIAPVDKTMSSQPVTSAVVEKSSNLLFWLLGICNLILLSLTILFLVLWQKAKSRQPQLDLTSKPTEQKEAEAFKQLKQLAHQNNPSGFREALINWSRIFWQRPIFTLEEVAQLTNIPSLNSHLKTLDQGLYHTETHGTADLSLLFEEIKAVRKQSKTSKSEKGNHLKPLYEKS
jgi:hypothetical protein